MLFVCPELANANDPELQEIINRLNAHVEEEDPNAQYMAPPVDQRGDHGANVVILNNHHHRLFFYHVDTCLAIIFILDNGMVIGGHAGMIVGDIPNGQPEIVLLDMQNLIPLGSNINVIHLVGDIEAFHPDINDIIERVLIHVPPIQWLQQDVIPVDITVSHGLINWHIEVLPHVAI